MTHQFTNANLTRLGMTPTILTASFFSNDHFHLDLLKRELVVDQIQQLKRALVRHLIATQFDPRRFARELGMRCQHFAIEQERDIRVEFLLDLMQPLVRAIPRPRLSHRENDLVRSSVHAEKIDDGRVGNAGDSIFLLLIMIVLLILRHWAE